MAAPLTKQEIHRRVETIELLILTLKAQTDPAAQAETYEVLKAYLASLLGDLYEDISRGQ